MAPRGALHHGPAARLGASAACPAARFLACLLLVLALGACASRHGRPGAGRAAPPAQESLPRADPGYLQWLERQSMLGAAPELTAQVSGTERVWRNNAGARRTELLLRAAPNWLEVNPWHVSAGRPAVKELAQAARLPGLPEFMAGAGLGGIFLAPTGEKGDIWHQRKPSSPDGENVTGLRLDPVLGGDDDLAALTERLEQLQIQMGGELPPAATGLGPDFILQARRASRFDGLYAMLAVPRPLWRALPPATGEWDCRPLSVEAAAALRSEGLLPPELARDHLPWASPGGWAATGEVRGADGQARRWAYRYSGHELRPVLLWQDPSGQARRVFSAAVIRHTGLQGQALAGLRLEALMGLDAAPEGRAGEAPPGAGQNGFAGISGTAGRAEAEEALLAPGLEALDALSREVRRYGGWAMQDDVLPASLTPALLRTGVDFTRDSATAPAAAYALLSGDAAPLAAFLRAALASGADQSRVARGLRQGWAVDLRPLLELPQGGELVRKTRELGGGGPDGTMLEAGGADLAARALGLKDASMKPEQSAALREACLMLLGWRVALPGPVFVSLQDMTGAMRPWRASGSVAEGVPLWAEHMGVGLSVPPAALAFGPLDRQWAERDSFARRVARLLRARSEAGLARGALVAVLAGEPGCVAVLSALPQGGYWLFAANFSDRKRTLTLNLPAGVTAGSARDVPDGQSRPLDGRALVLDLEARQSRHVLLAGRAAISEGATP